MIESQKPSEDFITEDFFFLSLTSMLAVRIYIISFSNGKRDK